MDPTEVAIDRKKEHVLIVECFASGTGCLRSYRFIGTVYKEHVVKQPHELWQRIPIHRFIAEIEFSHFFHDFLVLGTCVCVIEAVKWQLNGKILIK